MIELNDFKKSIIENSISNIKIVTMKYYHQSGYQENHYYTELKENNRQSYYYFKVLEIDNNIQAVISSLKNGMEECRQIAKSCNVNQMENYIEDVVYFKYHKRIQKITEQEDRGKSIYAQNVFKAYIADILRNNNNVLYDAMSEGLMNAGDKCIAKIEKELLLNE